MAGGQGLKLVAHRERAEVGRCIFCWGVALWSVSVCVIPLRPPMCLLSVVRRMCGARVTTWELVTSSGLAEERCSPSVLCLVCAPGGKACTEEPCCGLQQGLIGGAQDLFRIKSFNCDVPLTEENTQKKF